MARGHSGLKPDSTVPTDRLITDGEKGVFKSEAFFRLQQGVFTLHLSIMGYIRGAGHLFYIIRPSHHRKAVTAVSLTRHPPPPGDSSWDRQFLCGRLLKAV